MTENLPMTQTDMTPAQVDLVKRTVAVGSTNDELALFLYTCKRTGLDPLARQIHAVMRWNGKAGKNVMSIQTGIDGYRLIADRTGKYAPGDITISGTGEDMAATAAVKKLVEGTWHIITATAYFPEYCQRINGQPMGLWARMPKLMLGKCAEALALRRAFPAELSGVYTHEEMQQADSDKTATPPAPAEDKDDLTKALEAPVKTADGKDPIEVATGYVAEKTADAQPKPECFICGKGITEKVAVFSIQKFKQPLCMACQKKQ